MKKAARAIVIENNELLLMQREKEGQTYFTLVGGAVNDNETTEEAVIREVREETGLKVTSTRLVFIEEHPAPYREQYTFLCEVEPHGQVALELTSEEAIMNRMGINTHTPVWAALSLFHNVPFRTVQLQLAILKALKEGFPSKTIKV